MESEQKCTILSMLFNTLLIVCALYGGTLIRNYTLICLGYFVMCDLIEDFLAFISSNANNRRASKKHPFGYGEFENYSSLVIGIIFTLLGIYIFTSSIHLSCNTANFFAFGIMFGCMLVRYINAEYQFSSGLEEQSQMLMTSAKDGFKGSIICFIACLILIANMFIPLFDLFGAVLMSLLIVYEGLKIVINNILYIKGQNDTSNSINEKLKKIINKYKGYNYVNVDLVNVRNYYLANIDIEIDDSVSLLRLFFMELKLKWIIKREIINIRFIDFDVYKTG